MRCASWVLATVVATAVTACSLTTSLSGLSNGDAIVDARDGSGADGGGDGSALDARSESSTTSEGGGPSSYREVVLADGPLAYYRLADQGSTAKDEVGNHDGVYKGTVTHGAGAIAGDANGAAIFDGVTGYVDVGDALPFLDQAQFTIEAWASPVAGATDPGCLAAKSIAPSGASGGLSDGYTLYLDSGTNAINVARYRSSSSDTETGAAVPNGRFTHVVATYDGAMLKVWLDGAIVALGSSTRPLASVANPLTIGAGRGGLYCYFRGALDEVAFYGVALADDRIRAHHAAGRGP